MGNVNRRLKKLLQIILEKKGEDVKVLDVRKVTWIADYFIILTGTTPIHTRSLAEAILEKIKEKPSSTEGFDGGSWILLDYRDIMVHIFLPQTRDFYRLEKLWGDAEEVKLNLIVF